MKVSHSILALLIAIGPVCAAEKIRVSSFSTVLTEVAQQVGGDRVVVHGHVKPGVDPHDFQPKPADLKIVSESQLVLLSAKHMEGYVNKLREVTGSGAKVIEVGDQFPSLKMKAGHHGHDHGPKDHDHGDELVEDPHWWHSIRNMERATKIVRDQLIALSPAEKAAFTANADQYLGRLKALEKWTKQQIAEIPRNKRKLVTSHEAFGYFAKEHGFTVYAVEGVTSADQPSSKKVAELIETVKKQSVKAIFTEDVHNPKVAQEIMRETGAKFGGELYSDGLGTGPAATYDGMYRHNVRTIVDALK